MALIGIVGLLLCVNLHAVHCDTYNEFLATTLPDLCPYSTFCTMGPSEEFNHKDASPCCKACSCADDCLMYGNCCPDYTPPRTVRRNSMVPTVQCAAPVHYGYDTYELDLAMYYHLDLGFYDYYIISSCLDGYSDHDVINKCINVDIENMWDNAIVSDSKGRVFFNQYCAKCNNVQAFTRWDLKLFCWTYPNYGLTDVQNLQFLKENECMIMSSPPTENIALESRCYSVQYDKCNMTGRWKEFHAQTQRACESTTLPYLVQRFISQTAVYKNVYCYLCNAGKDIITKDVCLPEIIDDEQSSKLSHTNTFSALLEGPVFTKRTSKCQTSYIYDDHFKKCRLMDCPFSLLPNNGKCVKLFKEESGMAIFSLIDVTYGDDNTKSVYSAYHQSPRNNFNHFESIAQHIHLSLGMERYGCTPCMSDAFVRYDKTGVIYNLGFVTNKRCPAASIIEMINKWRLNTRSLSLNMDTQQLMFVPVLSFDWDIQDDPSRIAQRLTMFWDELRFDGRTNRVWPKFYCAHVDLLPNEYTQVLALSKTVHLSDFAAISNLADSVIYRICVEDYLPYNNEGVSVNSYLVERICTVTILILMVF